MGRPLTSHRVNPMNDRLFVEALDAPSHGGASHHYQIDGFNTQQNPAIDSTLGETQVADLVFQCGPIGDFGVNGISNEALLAIVEDRLKGFQSGPYACRENALALTKLQEAMFWLHHRTRQRIERGVEGTHQV